MVESNVNTANDLLTRAEERIGTVLRDKYRLDTVLGIGGMTAVFSATNLRNEGRVAIKILHSDFAIEGKLRERFRRESYTANRIDHSGTVRVLDDDIAEDGSIFLVLDFVEGETLEERWRRNARRLPVAEVVAFTQELLGVLSAAHRKGVYHRDIKPENVIVTPEGRLRVLNFGIAPVREAPPMFVGSWSAPGMPAFLPPELALGRAQEIDATSDIWSVGATAFSLLAGRFVHEGDTAEELLTQAATQFAPSLSSLARNVPTRIADVIDRALAFDKADRWPTARAMQDALARAQTEWSGADDEEEEEEEEDNTKIELSPPLSFQTGTLTSATAAVERELASGVEQELSSGVQHELANGIEREPVVGDPGEPVIGDVGVPVIEDEEEPAIGDPSSAAALPSFQSAIAAPGVVLSASLSLEPSAVTPPDAVEAASIPPRPQATTTTASGATIPSRARTDLSTRRRMVGVGAVALVATASLIGIMAAGVSEPTAKAPVAHGAASNAPTVAASLSHPEIVLVAPVTPSAPPAAASAVANAAGPTVAAASASPPATATADPPVVAVEALPIAAATAPVVAAAPVVAPAPPPRSPPAEAPPATAGAANEAFARASLSTPRSPAATPPPAAPAPKAAPMPPAPVASKPPASKRERVGPDGF